MDNKTVKKLISNCLAILLDIEGTTTSIDFVKNELFPYAQNNAKAYLDEMWDADETKDIINDLYLEYVKEYSTASNDIYIAAKEYKLPILVKFIEVLIKADRKLPALKKLQGLIWRKAYETGTIFGHVYKDVETVLIKWNDQKLPVYIYSSGSIAAQKLLFKHSVDGDLLHYISGHFDTSIGSKLDSVSYEKIAKSIDIPPQSIVFITDVPEEAEKASIAQLKVIISKRPGTVLYGKEVRDYPSISSFDELWDTRPANED